MDKKEENLPATTTIENEKFLEFENFNQFFEVKLAF